MKIESIQLKNFGPYHEALIPLEHVTSGTVCGQNGAGKSSGMVDAPLWSLFGKCRIQADKMITLGETDMAVTLIMALNGQRYRITRSRSVRTKAGRSDLQLQVSDADGQWLAIGGQNIAETQEIIEDLLQATYDTCTSTNFLIQGQFDQVSKATPMQRKTLLCDILGIAKYADYAVQSRLLGSRAEGELGQVLRETEALQEAVGRFNRAVDKRAVASSLLSTILLQEATLQAEHQQVLIAYTKAQAQLEVQQAEVRDTDDSFLVTQVTLLTVSLARKKAKWKRDTTEK